MKDPLLTKISHHIHGILPGNKAHSKLSPPNRLIPSAQKLKELDPKIASVLALIFREQDQYKLVFIRRQVYKGIHSGQISFPGGKVEPSDTSLHETALRETEEEIGVIRNNVQLLGALSSLYIPPSNFLVHPYVGFLEEKPIFTPSQKEVNKVLTLDLHNFTSKSAIQIRRVNAGNHNILCPCYEIEDNIIWGATAMIVSELVEITRQ